MWIPFWRDVETRAVKSRAAGQSFWSVFTLSDIRDAKGCLTSKLCACPTFKNALVLDARWQST